MIEALSNSLPIALALALSPAPVIAVIIILMTPKGDRNVLSYLVGWFMGILLIALIIFALPDFEQGETEGSLPLDITQLALALLFLGTALWKWIHRPRKGEPRHTPKLFRHLDEFGPFQSMFMGFALSGLNIKNISLIVAGALAIQLATSEWLQIMLSLLVFGLIGTSLLIFVVVVYYARRTHIDPIFVRWKRWLIKHNNLILIIILVVFGSILLRNGLQGVLSL